MAVIMVLWYWFGII